MKPWQYAVVGLAFLATAGCRVDPSIPILERELRLKEDEIYRLRGMLEDMQDVPVTCRDRGGDGHGDTETSGPRRKSSAPASHGATPPQVEHGRPSSTVPDSLKSPAGSLPPGIPDVPAELQGPSKPSTGAGVDGPTLQSGAEAKTVSRGIETVSFVPSGDSRQVASIALNRMLTGGISADERAGDQGLLVVVEPRDASGRVIDAPADISVVALDPALDGEAMRLGRWDFTAAEIESLFRRSGAGSAIHLSLGWPDEAPKHKKLHVFVRYVTADGRKLQADQLIEIAMPGEKTARWTPAEATMRSGPSLEAPPVADSWRPSELPTSVAPPPAQMAPAQRAPVHTATRTSPTRPERPVWSPERR